MKPVILSSIMAVIFSSALNAQSSAILTARAGTVEILKNGVWTPAVSGDPVASGERLRTGNLSSAALQFSSGKIYILIERTEVELSGIDGAPLVKTGRTKVVSVEDIVNAANVPVQAPVPAQTETDDPEDSRVNITIVNGGAQSEPVIHREEPSWFQRGVTYPTYYVYPSFGFATPGFVPNVQNPYNGIRPGQIVPPMTDPLRPPVHFPAR